MVKTGQGKLTSLRRRKTEGLYQPQEHDESLQLTEERDRNVAVGGEIHESEEDSLNGEESSFGDFSDSDEEWPISLLVSSDTMKTICVVIFAVLSLFALSRYAISRDAMKASEIRQDERDAKKYLVKPIDFGRRCQGFKRASCVQEAMEGRGSEMCVECNRG